MENQVQTNQDLNYVQAEMPLTNESMELLKTGAKWAKFLSILGFVGTGFMVLAALLMMAVSTSGKYQLVGGSPIPNGLLGFIYLVMAGVYFYPTLCLFNFSDKIKKAFITLDNNVLVESFRNLKNMFQYIGIVTIVFIGLYIVGILVLVIVMAGRLI
jgi:hypothetical protein